MRTDRVGLLLALSLFPSALPAQTDTARTPRHVWVAAGIQQLWRWGDVVIEGKTAGSPTRTVLLGRAGSKLGYQVVAGMPMNWENINVELYGQMTGKRTLQDSTGQSIGTVEEIIVAVGIDNGVFRPGDRPVALYGGARIGGGFVRYRERIPVGLPKSATVGVLAADAGVTIRLAPPLRVRLTVGLTPATAGPLFYMATGGLVARLPF